MTELTIYRDDAPGSVTLVATAPEAIAGALARVGVRFERWNAAVELAADATHAQIIDAYADDIERLKTERGYRSVDVVSLKPDHPDREALRRKFLDEHTHAEDEVRFFVEGSGAFYLHLDGQVHQVICTRGDLLSVPAGTPHWFDMGPAPHFTAIRLFTNPQGWVAQFTGQPIAAEFPRYGEPGQHARV